MFDRLKKIRVEDVKPVVLRRFFIGVVVVFVLNTLGMLYCVLGIVSIPSPQTFRVIDDISNSNTAVMKGKQYLLAVLSGSNDVKKYVTSNVVVGKDYVPDLADSPYVVESIDEGSVSSSQTVVSIASRKFGGRLWSIEYKVVLSMAGDTSVSSYFFMVSVLQVVDDFMLVKLPQLVSKVGNVLPPPVLYSFVVAPDSSMGVMLSDFFTIYYTGVNSKGGLDRFVTKNFGLGRLPDSPFNEVEVVGVYALSNEVVVRPVVGRVYHVVVRLRCSSTASVFVFNDVSVNVVMLANHQFLVDGLNRVVPVR